MARIQEYTAPPEKLTPSGLGDTAWTGAGRRIAPAYNEGAHFLEKSGVQFSQAAAGAEQSAKLNNALLDQYKLMAAVYPGLESPEGRIKEPAAHGGGGGGGVSVASPRGGGSATPNREISNAARDLTDWAQQYNNNGLLHNKYEGENKTGTAQKLVMADDGTLIPVDEYNKQQEAAWKEVDKNNTSLDESTQQWYLSQGTTSSKKPTTTYFNPMMPVLSQPVDITQGGPSDPTAPDNSMWGAVQGGVSAIINAISGPGGYNTGGSSSAGIVPGDTVDQAAGTGAG